MSFKPATDLTDAEKRAMTELRAGMLWTQGFFSHIMLDQCELVVSRDVPKAATDGKRIWLNPEYFAKLNLEQRMYILTHEICHVMWEHCEQAWQMRDGILGPKGMMKVDHQLCNEVQDWTINAFLDECKIGEHPPEGHFNPRVKGGESWVKIYAEEYERREKDGQDDNNQGGSGGGQGQRGSNPGGFDQHQDPGQGEPGKSPAEAVQERKDKATEWVQAINQAYEVAKSRGDVPAAIKRLVDAVLEPKIDWRERLASLVTKNIGGGDHDWRHPDPIMTVFADPVYMPNRAGKGVGTVVVACDTSGSVGQKELNMVTGTMVGIFEQAMPKTVHVIFCDAKVHGGIHTLDNPSDVEAVEIVRDKAIGGGGTDFRPVFDALDGANIIPEQLIYVTDGYGSYPQHPPTYPVIWAIIPGGQNSCPWGEEVKLEF